MTQPITYTAYRIALMIIKSEDFELKIDKNEDGDKIFKLVDDNSVNWGDIESDEFYNLATVIDRLEVYHDDYYFKEFEEKCNPDILSGKVPPNLSDGKPFEKYSNLAAICWFVTNSADILSKITPDVVEAFEYDMTLSFVDKFDRNTDEECLHYYVRKVLFNLMFETLSAYRVVEFNNRIYCSAYGDADLWKSDKKFYKLISKMYSKYYDAQWDFDQWLFENYIYKTGENDSSGFAYLSMLRKEENQIVDDLEDLGKEGHYFDEYAFAYLGMFDKWNQFKDNFIRINAIEWDLDVYPGEANQPDLPENVIIDKDSFYQLHPDVDLKNHDKAFDCIADYLSNTYGYCVKSFRLPK